MKRIIDRIRNSEFLTFGEVLKLKVGIVTIFLILVTLLSIPLSSLTNLTMDIKVFIPIALLLLILLTILLTVINFNRLAMHFSIVTVITLTMYNTAANQFYGYMMFFVTLTIIIFYQDILTYIFYGGSITGYGIYYVIQKGVLIIGVNSIDTTVSMYTYIVILVSFYLVFLVQFLVSDNIYEKMNQEWVRMNKVLEQYHDVTFKYLVEMIEQNKVSPIYENIKFQQTVSEISVFINEFFEEDAQKIAEVVEFYFFIHNQEVDELLDNPDASFTAKKYAVQLKKYLMNERSELVSMLFDFSTLLHEEEGYNDNRYKYNLDELFEDRIDKLLSLAILYKYLKTEITQFDKWGFVKQALTHEQITEMFSSKEFREFITYEQVNFYLDNEELFNKHL